MAEVGRNPWRTPGPKLLLRQEYQVLSGTMSMWLLKISRDGDSTTSLDTLIQYSVTLTVKKFFSHVQMELSLLQFGPTASCPVSRHLCKQPGPILLIPSLKILVHINKIPSQPSFLQAKSSVSLSSKERCSSPLVIFDMGYNTTFCTSHVK